MDEKEQAEQKRKEERADYEFVLQEVKDYNSAAAKGYGEGKDDCAICKNKRRIGVAEKHGQDWYFCVAECGCMSGVRINELKKQSRMQEKMAVMNFANFFTDELWQLEIYNTAKEFCGTNDKWFFIGGQSGTGKTHICTAICKELIERGKSVRYLTWNTNIKDLKMSNDNGYRQLFEEMFNTEVIYIDDLFKTANGYLPTDADIRIAYEILENCNRKTLLFSSERTIAEIERIDEAIAGRIKQKCGIQFCQTIPKNKAKNYRNKAVCDD